MNNSIKLEGTKEVILGMVAIIDDLNNSSDMAFRYYVSPTGDKQEIQITAAAPEHFFTLGIASNELLRKAFLVK